MIKSVLKTAGAMATGGILVFALTYNSKMPEIKAGVDNLKSIAIEAQVNASNGDLRLEELTKELNRVKEEFRILQENYNNLAISHEDYYQLAKKLMAENDALQAEIDALKGEVNHYKSELNKANLEIEKANSEQVEILDYVNQAIEEVKNK